MDTPSVLYKYTNSENALRTLKNGLSYSRASNYWEQDPCEFNFIAEKIKLVDLRLTLEAFSTREDKYNIIKNLIDNEDELQELCNELNSKDSIDRLIEDARTAIVDRYYICSLTSLYDDNALWEKYANNHDGVIFSISVDAINKVNQGEDNFLKKVEYKDSLTTSSLLRLHFDLDDNKEIIFSKMKKYEWAKEYRLLLNIGRVHSMEQKHLFYEPRKVIGQPHFIHDMRFFCYLKSISIGRRCKKPLAKEIKAVIARTYPHVKIVEL